MLIRLIKLDYSIFVGLLKINLRGIGVAVSLMS